MELCEILRMLVQLPYLSESESESEFHLFEPHIQKKYLVTKCGSGDPC